MSDSYEFLKAHRDRIEAAQRKPMADLLDKLRAIGPHANHSSVLLSASTFREIVAVLESATPSHAEILSPEEGKAHASADPSSSLSASAAPSPLAAVLQERDELKERVQNLLFDLNLIGAQLGIHSRDEIEGAVSRLVIGMQSGQDAIVRSAVAGWQARAEAAEAQLSALTEALRRIAEHDGERGDFVNDVFERKPSPQEIADAALAALRTGSASSSSSDLAGRLRAVEALIEDLAETWRTVGDNYSAIQYEHAAKALEYILRESKASALRDPVLPVSTQEKQKP